MAETDIDRLGRAYLGARERGDTTKAQMYAKELRRLSGGANTSVPVEEQGLLGSIGEKLYRGVDQVVKGVGATLSNEVSPEVGSAVGGLTTTPTGPSDTERLYSGGGISEVDPTYLPGAIVEQSPQIAGGIAAAGTGAAIGSVAGPVGALAGGIAGGALFGIAQLWGNIANERARNNGREVANEEDRAVALGTAAVSGALDKFGVGKGSGVVAKIVKEGFGEFTQSGIEQTGGSAGTEAGLSIDPTQMAVEGVLGSGVRGGIAATGAAASTGAQVVRHGTEVIGEKVRYDDVSEDYQMRAAQRIYDAADGNMEILSTVATKDPDKGAQGAAKAALEGVRAEGNQVVNDLRALARETKNAEGIEAVNALQKVMGQMKSRIPETFIDRVKRAFPSEPAIDRFVDLARQAGEIQTFTVGEGDLGGLSEKTRRIDITDPRASGLATGGMLAALGSLGRMSAAATTMGGATAVNRVARGIDIWTNRRSPIKRYVESAQRNGTAPPEITGDAGATLAEYKRKQSALKAYQTYQLDLMKENARKAKRDATIAKGDAVRAEREKKRQEALTVAKTADEAKKLADATLKLAAAKSTEAMFASGVVPTHPYYDGYRTWQEFVGLDPKETLAAIQQIEQAGNEPAIPPGTAQRFMEDIRGIGSDPLVYEMQQAVIRNANPGFVYKPPTPEKARVNVLDKLKSVTEIKPEGNRRKYKGKQGELAGINLSARIEDAKDSVKPDTYLALLDLRQEIDSPAMTKDMRKVKVDETLGKLFYKKTMRDMWRVHFGPLVTIGNDIVIERPATDPDTEADTKLEEAVSKAKSKKAAKKPRKTTAQPVGGTPDAPEADPGTTPTPKPNAGLRAAQALPEAPKDETPTEGVSAAEDVREAVDPDFSPEPKKAKGKTGIKAMVTDRIESLFEAITMANAEGGNLENYIRSLPKSTEGRVEALFYEIASHRLTMNMLVDKFASRFSMDPVTAASAVDSALQTMEADGILKRFRPSFNSSLKVDGEYKKDASGNPLSIVDIEFLEPELKARMEIAKAVNLRDRMVDQKELPRPYSPNGVTQGGQRAFKNYQKDFIDASFKPILDFINSLRESPLSVSNTMLTQIESALDKSNEGRNVGELAKQLTPREVKKLPNGKTKTEVDKGPLRAVAQLLFQLGTEDERVDNRIRQEWMAGDNLRVYSKNGSASSQGGDLMKGIMRAPVKAPLRDQSGVDFLFHSFGNLLGYDKESPAARRQSVFNDPDAIDALIDFANDPFGRTAQETSTGKDKAIKGILKTGEGFFQVLNVANELRAISNWVKARNPKDSKTPISTLLQRADVRADLAKYETDFLVQLDANNNAYQLAGTALGDPSVLQATGMLPPPDGEGDADSRRGADIYMAPALSIAERVPELKALRDAGLSDSKLRKLFKGAIGTFLYAAQFESRRNGFKLQLRDIADGADIFGVDGTGLIEVPPAVFSGMSSPEGYRFLKTSFDENGDVTKEEPVRRRLVEKEGKFYIETAASQAGKFTRGTKPFGSPEEAVSEAFSRDFYGRLNRELVSDLTRRFPRIREYLNFADVVSSIIKRSSAPNEVKVPTPDGMVLHYAFKQNQSYDGVNVTLPNGDTVNMGVKGSGSKLKGRGLAAFMTHQLDSYVLRESHKRLQANGGLLAFNPIHDSFGFHPSEAARGQETVVGVMQELQTVDYNLFLSILLENDISLSAFAAAGGVMPERGDVPQVPPSAIPTAVS